MPDDEHIVELHLPAKELSPNARVHWSKSSRAKKAYRHAAYILALDSGVRGLKFESYRLEFTFKDNRRRDRDNATASMKSALDGIADAVKQDDSEWEFDGVRFTEPNKENPCVKVIFKIQGA